jgi:hypothetical protein
MDAEYNDNHRRLPDAYAYGDLHTDADLYSDFYGDTDEYRYIDPNSDRYLNAVW